MGIKYHISDDGRPARCRASKRACPKGPHFLSQGEAQEYLDNNMDESIQRQKKFKQLSTNTVEQELKNKKSKTNKILELSKRKATGFNYEVFMANNYARTKNLNNVMIRNEETGKWNTSTFAEQRLSKEEAQKLYKNAARAV